MEIQAEDLRGGNFYSPNLPFFPHPPLLLIKSYEPQQLPHAHKMFKSTLDR